MNARGSGRANGPSSVDAYQLELDQVFGDTRLGQTPATDQPRRTAPAAPVNADPSEAEHECPELDEAHGLLDALGAGDREQTVAARLRDFIERAAGQRAAAALNPDFGTALASYHLEHSGHPEACPCNPCRQARLMR